MAPLTETIAFRLTTGEKRALDALVKKRAAEMSERGDAPDNSYTGYLRGLIRRDAKAADIAVDEAPAASKKATPKRVR